MDDDIADYKALRREIRDKYRNVAVDPDRSFDFLHWPPARTAARLPELHR